MSFGEEREIESNQKPKQNIQNLKIPENLFDNSPNKEILEKEKNIQCVKESNFNFKIVLTLEKVKDILDLKEQGRLFFDVTIWLKFKHFCCKNTLSEKELFYMKIYRKCEEIIIQEMDIMNYLKFINEYTHIKCILFNEIHSLCLSFMEKPKVYENNRFTKIKANNHKKVFDIFNHFKSKNEKTKEDIMIFELLSKSLKKMIRKFK